MGDSKKAARDFVDKYFPVRGEPNSKGADVLGDLFPPKSEQGYVRKQGYESQSFTSQRATTADGKPRGNPSKSQSVSQKGINQGSHCEMSEPCLMSSSVDYGCRDNYPYNPDCRYPGPAAYSVPDKNERKNGSKYGNPEIQGAEWWQGSFYY